MKRPRAWTGDHTSLHHADVWLMILFGVSAFLALYAAFISWWYALDQLRQLEDWIRNGVQGSVTH